MGQEIQTPDQSRSDFEDLRHTDSSGVEFWYGRELADVLGYTTWKSFRDLITRAMVSVNSTGLPVENHFEEVSKMVSIGYGNDRAVEDFKLTRHACYVIAQNGNPTVKPRIAEAQAYFAVQTRKRELELQYQEDMKRLALRQEFSESDKRLSGAVLEQDIHPRGLGIIKNQGDQKFFGGKSSAQIKQAYGILKKTTPWADKAPNVVLAAKTLANELTANNIERRGFGNFPAILQENNDNNHSVRETLIERGVVPENEPPAEDTKLIKKRVKGIGKSDFNSTSLDA